MGLGLSLRENSVHFHLQVGSWPLSETVLFPFIFSNHARVQNLETLDGMQSQPGASDPSTSTGSETLVPQCNRHANISIYIQADLV